MTNTTTTTKRKHFRRKHHISTHLRKLEIFLAVQNSSIGDLVPWLLGLTPLTVKAFTTLQSDPRDLTFETFDQTDF